MTPLYDLTTLTGSHPVRYCGLLMAKDTSFHEFVMNELFADIDGITSRPMFGGFGIYKDGVIFALIGDERLLDRKVAKS